MSSYTEKQVFDINDANRVVDMIYYQIEKYISENSIEGIDLLKDIALTGAIANKLQGGTSMIFKQIVLATDVKLLYNILLKVVHLVNNKGIIQFKERIIIYNDEFIIELWLFDEATLNITAVDDIIVQQIAQIPEILL